ncbi:hypothetical protein EON62_01990 [archaeon]|nr:MAG: hypothetical protein EON62_01990 [archaeon]
MSLFSAGSSILGELLYTYETGGSDKARAVAHAGIRAAPLASPPHRSHRGGANEEVKSVGVHDLFDSFESIEEVTPEIVRRIMDIPNGAKLLFHALYKSTHAYKSRESEALSSTRTGVPLQLAPASQLTAIRAELLKSLVAEASRLNRCAPTSRLLGLRASAYLERGKSLQMLDRHREATVDLTVAMAHMPNSGFPVFRRAFAFRALRRFEAAADDFELARSLEPRDDRFNVNYVGLDDVNVVILCASGEEPATPLAGVVDEEW